MRFSLVLAAVIFLIPLLAQNDRGTITGTVTDPAAAVVPGATITAKNIENGATYETVATDTGNYTIPSVTAGTYELAVQASGFTRFVQQGIRVQVAQVARIDVKLQIGSSTDSDRKSTRLNSSHLVISYAVFCLKKKKQS